MFGQMNRDQMSKREPRTDKFPHQKFGLTSNENCAPDTIFCPPEILSVDYLAAAETGV
jgi:hypothetical protein